MQAWFTCSGGRTSACDPHALGEDQCCEQRKKISVVSNVAPTLSTAHQHQEAAEGAQEEIDPEGCGTEGQTVSMKTSMK